MQGIHYWWPGESELVEKTQKGKERKGKTDLIQLVIFIVLLSRCQANSPLSLQANQHISSPACLLLQLLNTSREGDSIPPR